MGKVRAWFFEPDNGWYEQGKYGSKALTLGKDGNAGFANTLADVEGALQAFYDTAAGGELDAATGAVMQKKAPK